jgi:hypothetical protein
MNAKYSMPSKQAVEGIIARLTDELLQENNLLGRKHSALFEGSLSDHLGKAPANNTRTASSFMGSVSTQSPMQKHQGLSKALWCTW